MEHEQRVLAGAVVEAGQRALIVARNTMDVQTKADRSPVTSADLEVNRLLHEALIGAFPQDAWLSEESPDTPARLQHTRVWIVDPIDGTKALVGGRPTWVISAALAVDHQVVLGCIYNPSTGELFSAQRGKGAFLNGHPIRANAGAVSPLPLLVNHSEAEGGRFAVLGDRVTHRSLGSIAYSLALVASGAAPAMITFDRENEWDVAAATVLLEEAGGSITDGEGRPFRFNQPTPTYRGTIGVSAPALSAVAPFVEQLRRHLPPPPSESSPRDGA
ncbi:MAG: 3'(2'),5'-bisphosphate nucleotidase CysQ [Nitrospiraceae bacterium]